MNPPVPHPEPFISLFNTSLLRQFNAALNMLENGIRACPDALWTASLWAPLAAQPIWSQAWYVVYHCLFWLDLYLSGAVEGFTPPAPFNLDELDPAGLVPERVYTRAELLSYLAHGRAKCGTVLGTLTPEDAARLCKFPWSELPFAELLLDNLRHVQEHGAQLNLLLGQHSIPVPRWVGTTDPDTITT